VSSVVHATARLGAGTTLGEFCVVGPNVTIGSNCRLGNHVVIHADTVVGNDVRIDDHASLGKLPMKAANSATTKEQDLPPLTVGDVCIVGTGVVLYRGAAIDGKVLMADLSTVRENVTVGRGTIVGRGVTIENFCSVGRYCKLESESYLCAYSTLEDRVFVAPGVVTSNDNFVGRTQERFKHFKGVTVKKGGRIGACSVTLPGVVIGEDALVAAGSTVTKAVDPRMIVMGKPARPVRPVPVEQLLENQGWVDA